MLLGTFSLIILWYKPTLLCMSTTPTQHEPIFSVQFAVFRQAGPLDGYTALSHWEITYLAQGPHVDKINDSRIEPATFGLPAGPLLIEPSRRPLTFETTVEMKIDKRPSA